MKSSLLLVMMVLASTVARSQTPNFSSHDFKRADSVAALYSNHSLQNLNELARKLTLPFSTDEEKFRAIYVWICNNIENDYQFYFLNKRKRATLSGKPALLQKWNKEFARMSFNKLLDKHQTVCSGYAYLVKELSMLAGLPCKIVDGYGRTSQANVRGDGDANHTWNAIKLSGQWYLCDATWSSGGIDTHLKRFIKKFDDTYFLTDPSIFIRNHYPLDTSMMLLKKKPTLHQFLNAPLIYSSLYAYRLNPVMPEKFDVSALKGETVKFCFAKNSQSKTGKLEVAIVGIDNSPEIFFPEVIEGDSEVCFEQIFSHTGKVSVHILLDSNYVMTYAVRVK